MGGSELTVLGAIDPENPCRHLAPKCEYTFPESAAQKVDTARRIVQIMKTGLFPIAAESGTQTKAPTPQNNEGTEERYSIRMSFKSYCGVRSYLRLDSTTYLPHSHSR